MRTVAITGLLLLAIFAIGCNRGPEQARRIEPEYDKQTGRLRVLRYDSDGDGNADAISHMDGARVLFIEIDRNADGVTDRWEYYDASEKLEKVGFSRANDGKEDAWSYAGADGSIARIDVSLARDGKVTRREYYEKEALIRAEEDSDGDGLPDKWETYDRGRLATVAFDTAHRGTPDRRLVYGPEGDARLEIDPDGDGTFVVQQ